MESTPLHNMIYPVNNVQLIDFSMLKSRVPDQKYEYKYNIIYHRTDEKETDLGNFVHFLVDVLEENELTGFYPYRDFLPGRNLFDEQFRVINASQFTIIVLDKNFIRNDWTTYWGKVRLKHLI